MYEFIRIIKRAALEAVEAAKPVNILIGKVQSETPLTVRINQKLVLDRDFLLVPEHLKEDGFHKGDGIFLLREQGGQRFLILGKAG